MEPTPFYRELPTGRIEHRAEPLILVLALLVIPAIVLETSSSSGLRSFAFGLNLVIWLGFAVELAFVLCVTTDRARTLRAHWLDAAIVLVSVPVTPELLQSARALRLLRLLRFVRLAVFSGRALTAARAVFSPSGFRYVLVLAALLVVVSGAALAAVEADEVTSLGDGIWLALVTVTTVGYGDIVPQSTAGRAVISLVMLAGISVFALLTATISATFVKQDERPDELRERLDEINARLERIEQELTRTRASTGRDRTI